MANTSRIPLTVIKNGVETRLDSLASWVETRDSIATGLGNQIGSPIEVAGRTGSMYLRGRHREEKSVVVNLMVNNTDTDGLTPSYAQFRKNLDAINKLFDTTNSQIALIDYLGGTYEPNNSLTRVNLAFNPDFRATSGTVTVRTNLCTNPSFPGNDLTGWGRWPGVGSPDSTLTREAGAGADGQNGYMRQAWSTAAPTSGGGMYWPHNGMASKPGVPYTASAYVRCSKSVSVSMQVQFYNGAMSAPTTAGQGPITAVPANTWTRVSGTLAPDANGTLSQFRWYINGAGLAAGDTFDVDCVLVEESPLLGSYFDGSTANGSFDLNLSSAWTGTPNASTSIATGPRLEYWTFLTGFTAAWQAEDGGSAYVRVVAANGITAATSLIYSAVSYPASPGQQVSASMRVLGNETARIRIFPYSDGTQLALSGYSTGASNGQTTAVDGFTTPANTNGFRIIVNTQANVPAGTTYRVDQALAEVVPSASFYFDGDSQGAAWTGTAQRSTSVLSSPGARKAIVEVRSKYTPDYTDGFEHASMKIECVINSGVWSDVGTYTYASALGTSIMGTPLTLTPLVGGNTEIEDAFIIIDGPINSPTLTDIGTGSTLKLTTNVPAGQQWVVDCSNYTTRVGTNIEGNPTQGSSMSRYTFSTGPLAPSMFPIHPDAIIQLNGSGAGTTTRIRITASRKYH